MAEFTEVMEQKERMCNVIQYNNCASCKKCGLYRMDMTCNSFMIKYPQEAEFIIMKWASENHINTNADKFREVFGFNIDVSSMGCNGIKADCSIPCSECKVKNFWNKEYKEPKEVEQKNV